MDAPFALIKTNATDDSDLGEEWHETAQPTDENTHANVESDESLTITTLKVMKTDDKASDEYFDDKSDEDDAL